MARNFLMVQCKAELKERLKRLGDKWGGGRSSWRTRRFQMSGVARRLICEGLDSYEKKLKLPPLP